jgi:hypothetical protein
MELAAKIGTGTLARAVVAAGTLGATNSSGAEKRRLLNIENQLIRWQLRRRSH